MKGLEEGRVFQTRRQRGQREVVMGVEAREGRGGCCFFTDGRNHARDCRSPRELDKAGNDCPLCPPPRRHASPPHIHSAQ